MPVQFTNTFFNFVFAESLFPAGDTSFAGSHWALTPDLTAQILQRHIWITACIFKNIPCSRVHTTRSVHTNSSCLLWAPGAQRTFKPRPEERAGAAEPRLPAWHNDDSPKNLFMFSAAGETQTTNCTFILLMSVRTLTRFTSCGENFSVNLEIKNDKTSWRLFLLSWIL